MPTPNHKKATNHPLTGMDTPTATLVARWYFNQYPPHSWADQHGQHQVHLVFAGFSPLVEAMLCQYAKISPYKDFAPPVFTLLGSDAEQHRQHLVERYPVFANGRTGAEQVIAGLYAVTCAEDFTLEPTQVKQLTHPAGQAIPLTAVLCCAEGDEANRQHALHLHQQNLHHHYWQAPVYFYQQGKAATPLPEGLIRFGMTEQVFDPTQQAAVERNARAVHEAYRQTMLANATADMASSADSLKPWEQLAETYRSPNYRAGDHFAVKLASIGYATEPGKPLQLDNIRLDEPPERRELLSRLEHRSWRYERLLNGWRYGKVRDNQQRLHPSIVLWEDLSASERQKDVNQIEMVRQVLMAK